MNSTMKYYGRKKVIVQFVKELLLHSDENLQSITITPQVKSEDSSVSIVIDGSLADIVEKMALSYSGLRISTSTENTQAGLPLPG